MAKKILVVGGGGREHAIIKALKKSPDCGEIWCAPGNGGISYDAKCKNIKATDVETMVAFAAEEKKAYLSKVTGVCLGSDAFFPFGDNIERARRSGVTAIVQPGGSIRDQQVIDTCNKYGIAMAFCGLRLFHH